jgi:hypothetical protein
MPPPHRTGAQREKAEGYHDCRRDPSAGYQPMVCIGKAHPPDGLSCGCRKRSEPLLGPFLRPYKSTNTDQWLIRKSTSAHVPASTNPTSHSTATTTATGSSQNAL